MNNKPGRLTVRKLYECNFRVTDVSYTRTDSCGYSFCLCIYGCSMVVGGDFSVSSTISHRELVKSSACRLPALIRWNVQMCFSAAVIIILGTRAQINPLNCTRREREWERQHAPLTAHMSVFQQRCHLKGKWKKRGMTCLEKSVKGKK